MCLEKSLVKRKSRTNLQQTVKAPTLGLRVCSLDKGVQRRKTHVTFQKKVFRKKKDTAELGSCEVIAFGVRLR